MVPQTIMGMLEIRGVVQGAHSQTLSSAPFRADVVVVMSTI